MPAVAANRSPLAPAPAACYAIARMSAPTIFLSAASDDLEALRNVLHGAFSRAHFHVFTQKQSLGAAPGTLRDFLVDHIDKSDCVIHFAGLAFGSDAGKPGTSLRQAAKELGL